MKRNRSLKAAAVLTALTCLTAGIPAAAEERPYPDEAYEMTVFDLTDGIIPVKHHAARTGFEPVRPAGANNLVGRDGYSYTAGLAVCAGEAAAASGTYTMKDGTVLQLLTPAEAKQELEKTHNFSREENLLAQYPSDLRVVIPEITVQTLALQLLPEEDIDIVGYLNIETAGTPVYYLSYFPVFYVMPAEGAVLEEADIMPAGKSGYLEYNSAFEPYTLSLDDEEMPLEEALRICAEIEARDDVAWAWPYGPAKPDGNETEGMALLPVTRGENVFDMNGDGETSTADAVALMRYLAEDPDAPYSEKCLEMASELSRVFFGAEEGEITLCGAAVIVSQLRSYLTRGGAS